jgi:hypothetical protein
MSRQYYDPPMAHICQVPCIECCDRRKDHTETYLDNYGKYIDLMSNEEYLKEYVGTFKK